ncbi:capsular polysaccharide biosynthesis protein [Cellvibrio japonicus Ueda107]|uniref:Capsular polysaccharide biosynthesis protein n=1 Tax=Cellvibrio japonicus (strain Ueda107) TaxID=498211 RepID=B3PJK4_CELJU|nr:exopolysaccharide biosynthesis polyprenyl glycosylphosphotransferase [Cellvibrio japonicus]ACE85387.1 capsular polysaccharide biosynthesis protein [Cellvibrio japonicus Ueda107]
MGSQQLRDAVINPIALTSQPPVIRLHHSKILALFRALDSLLIAAILWSCVTLLGIRWTNEHTILGLSAIVLFGFFAEGNEVYYLWRGHSMGGLANRLFSAWLGTAMALLVAVLLIVPYTRDNLRPIFFWVALTPAAIISMHVARRVFLAHVRAKPTELRRVAIVGATHLGQRLVKSMQGMPWLGYRVVGFYDDRVAAPDNERRLASDDVNINGGLEQLYTDAHDGKVDIVFITLPMRAEIRMRTMIERLADTTVSAYLIPDVFSFDLLHSRLTCLQGIPALSIYDSPLVDNSWAKRAEDIVIGSAMLAMLAIPMAFIALGVKLTSSGPVFFKQTRYGMGGEKIKVWKFRSMTVCEDGSNVSQAQRADPRVTPFGNFLRKTSLDELPQLFNVISGSMSLVGPRPHAVRTTNIIAPRSRAICCAIKSNRVLPGSRKSMAIAVRQKPSTKCLAGLPMTLTTFAIGH